MTSHLKSKKFGNFRNFLEREFFVSGSKLPNNMIQTPISVPKFACDVTDSLFRKTLDSIVNITWIDSFPQVLFRFIDAEPGKANRFPRPTSRMAVNQFKAVLWEYLTPDF